MKWPSCMSVPWLAVANRHIPPPWSLGYSYWSLNGLRTQLVPVRYKNNLWDPQRTKKLLLPWELPEDIITATGNTILISKPGKHYDLIFCVLFSPFLCRTKKLIAPDCFFFSWENDFGFNWPNQLLFVFSVSPILFYFFLHYFCFLSPSGLDCLAHLFSFL